MPVVAVIAKMRTESDGEEVSGILSEIVDIPRVIKEFVQRKVPTFKKVYSKTTESLYYGNTCPNCGVLSGDFFLHCEPGAPFFPTEESEAKALYVTKIPLDRTVSIDAGIGFGAADLILEHARSI